MTASENLTSYLKHLRERAGISAKELAKQSKIHMSLIYKAETVGESVRISSLWEAYRGLCKDDEEWHGLLLRWALASCPQGNLSIYKAAEMVGTLREEASLDAQEKLDRITASLKRVKDADFPLLENFIRQYAANPYARDMTRAWMDAMNAPQFSSEDGVE